MLRGDCQSGLNNSIIIAVPKEFNFEFCLHFLQRSPRETLHKVHQDGTVHKAIQLGEQVIVISLSPHVDGLLLNVLSADHAGAIDAATLYVREWFDLDADLKSFYRMVRKDALLGPLVKKFRGHRIMSHPDLFESLIWAVLGQQINLQFAYTLKQRFVESFGTRMEVRGHQYYLFPTPERVARLTHDDLLPLQFSRQKSAYTVNIAQAFVSGEISKERLRGMTLTEAKERLMKIKGVGNWTANYALMRTFRYPDAFPLEDAGLHNALKKQLGLRKKPSIDRVKKIFKAYKGWEAYATVYLWKTL